MEATETALLIPDFFSTSFSYHNAIASLAKRNIRVATFDFPGTGHSRAQIKSPRVDNEYFVEFIALVTESLQLRATHVILHSSVSRIGLDYAIKYAKRVRTVSFVAVTPDGRLRSDQLMTS